MVEYLATVVGECEHGGYIEAGRVPVPKTTP
jgi:hypothetical protein